MEVSSTPVDPGTNNPLHQIRFETPTNATIVANGQAHTAAFVLTPPPNTFKTTFTVQRITSGQPVMVPFVVVDACGDWKTFVGGGANAGF